MRGGATLLLIAVLAAVVAGLAWWLWRLNRDLRQLRVELKAATQAEAIVARAQRRRHLAVVPMLWVAKQAKEHPVATAAAVGAMGAGALFAVSRSGGDEPSSANGATTTTVARTTSTGTTPTTQPTTTTGVTLRAVPPLPERDETGAEQSPAETDSAPVSSATDPVVSSVPSFPPQAAPEDGSLDGLGSPQPEGPSAGPPSSEPLSDDEDEEDEEDDQEEAAPEALCPLLSLELSSVVRLCL